MIEKVRRIRDAKKQIPNEVLVAFIDPHTRDMVAHHAINLAEAKGRDGQPNDPMQIEIPPSLVEPLNFWKVMNTIFDTSIAPC